MIWKKAVAVIFVFSIVTFLPYIGVSFFTSAYMPDGNALSSSYAAPTGAPVTYKDKQYAPNQNIINILLLGIDSDPSRQARSMGGRSDMMELCTIDLSANTMTLTAIPRDTRVKMYCVDAAGRVTNTITDKVNAAYSCGGGPDKFGPQNAEKCVSELLSQGGKYTVPVDYYISIDLAGIPAFASALGGISLPLDVDFPGLGQKDQTITLDERNAILYLSNRKDVGGDIVRDSHEQQYLIAVLKKIKQEGVVAAVPKLYGLLAQFMKTNLSMEQILTIAGALDKVGTDHIKLQVIKGYTLNIDDVSYYIADMGDVESKVIELMYSPVSR